MKPGHSFAELRVQFHQLVDLPESARAAQLAKLRADEPALAQAVAELLAATDFRDLQAPEQAAITRCGPYQVGQRLGAGGMGEVFVGERVDGNFQQRVALKILRPLQHGPMLHQRFLRERQILARLQHPQIARLLDGGMTESGRPWLAMELIEGQDLLAWCKSKRPSLDERIRLLIQVAEAVAFAHQQLVVHRDLKPANIRVGLDGQAKLLDFGVAKLLDDPSQEALSRFGLPMTPRYAAPEQILGEAVGTGADVHALGVLAFELCSGQMPYQPPPTDEQNWTGRVLASARLDLRLVLGADSGLSFRDQQRARQVLPDVLGKAMAREPGQRHQSAAALADDLRDWLAERAPRSGAGSRRDRLRIWLRHYRWPLAVGSSTLILILAALSVALWQAREASRQALRADRQTNALLEVLAAASPQHYAGRDPPASEFLLDAANRIHADQLQDAAGATRALSEIGNGLLNLGQSEAALKVLELAWQRAGQSSAINANQRLDLLKLQALAIEPERSGAKSASDRIWARLNQWVPQCQEPGLVLAAEAALGAVYAKLNDRERALALFAHAAPDQIPTSIPANLAENSLRQRGRGLLSLGEAALAAQSFEASMQLIAKHPEVFSRLRTAEAYWWLAEAEADQDAFQAAEVALAAAAPTVLAEYGPTHLERFRLQLHQALLAVLQGQAMTASSASVAALQARAEALSAREPMSSQAQFDLARLNWLISAHHQGCGSAWPDLPTARSIRQQLQLTQLQRWSERTCPTAP